MTRMRKTSGSNWWPIAVGLAVALVSSVSQAEVVPNLLYYHMDEASWSGTTPDVIDSSVGTQYDGTAVDGATTVADDYFGRAGTFDRSNDYVDCGNDSALSPTAEITMEACIKLASSGGSIDWKYGRAIVARTPSYYIEVRNHTDGKGHLAMYLYGTSNGAWLVADSVDMADYLNKWVHVAATFGDVGSGVKEILYINGLEVASVASGGSIDSSSGQTLVGWSAYNRFFDGEMAHVGVYDYALTPEQVNERYYAMLVPEPGAIVLLLIGLAGSCVFGRRGRRGR